MEHNRFRTLVLLMALCLVSPGIQAQDILDAQNKLSQQQKSIVKIASFTAQGNLEHLEVALNEGLDSGLTVNEIKEVLVHTYAYCGFPRSIMGLRSFLKVLDERKKTGIADQWGKEASPITDTRAKYDRGIETLEELILAKMDGTKPDYQQFSPEIDVFLKEHLFADIFERDVLTYAQRELATISVIASLGNLEPMLRGHFNISLNVGIKAGQLEEFVNVIASSANQEKADNAKKVLKAVLTTRN